MMFDLLFILAILILPVGLVFLLACISGWRKLAAAYMVQPELWRQGKTVPLCSAQVGGKLLGGINNGLNIRVSEEGLRFSVMIVGFAYRPFFVPWEDVDLDAQTKHFVTLSFKRVPDVPLRISAKTYDRVMALAPRTSES